VALTGNAEGPPPITRDAAAAILRLLGDHPVCAGTTLQSRRLPVVPMGLLTEDHATMSPSPRSIPRPVPPYESLSGRVADPGETGKGFPCREREGGAEEFLERLGDHPPKGKVPFRKVVRRDRWMAHDLSSRECRFR
jgi:hypothetical protein